jgi:ABC-type lipoprotein release transport system permease subunit
LHLAVANILEHKLRSALSALGIGIGICMFVTLSGLARGSLYEVSDRWEAVDADLIVYPRIWGKNITGLSGVGLSDSEAPDMLKHHGRIIERIVPVFLWVMNIADQDQVVVGTDSDESQWKTLTGGLEPTEGVWCDKDGLAARWLVERKLGKKPKAKQKNQNDAAGIDQAPAATQRLCCEELAERGGFELVMDDRLAKAGGYALGDTVTAAGNRWRIVGIVPAGVLGRAFMPRRTAQFLFANGNIKVSTFMFVKLRKGVDPLEAARKLRSFTRQAMLVTQYRQMLKQKFGVLFPYVDTVNAIALIIAFLFIMVTLYTIVLQRTRDIAILRSCGASGAFIIKQVLAESALLTAAGVVLGIALSFPAAWAIQTIKPLLTVTITWHWIAIAVGAAVVGAVASAVYPAWRALHVDVAEALTLE